MVPHLDGCTGTPPTFGCPGCIYAATPQPSSVRRRRTALADAMLAAGVHPANGRPLDRAHTCGDCNNCAAMTFAASTRYRCALEHRLVRIGWPACDRFTVTPQPANV